MNISNIITYHANAPLTSNFELEEKFCMCFISTVQTQSKKFSEDVMTALRCYEGRAPRSGCPL